MGKKGSPESCKLSPLAITMSKLDHTLDSEAHSKSSQVGFEKLKSGNLNSESENCTPSTVEEYGGNQRQDEHSDKEGANTMQYLCNLEDVFNSDEEVEPTYVSQSFTEITHNFNRQKRGNDVSEYEKKSSKGSKKLPKKKFIMQNRNKQINIILADDHEAENDQEWGSQSEQSYQQMINKIKKSNNGLVSQLDLTGKVQELDASLLSGQSKAVDEPVVSKRRNNLFKSRTHQKSNSMQPVV